MCKARKIYCREKKECSSFPFYTHVFQLLHAAEVKLSKSSVVFLNSIFNQAKEIPFASRCVFMPIRQMARDSLFSEMKQREYNWQKLALRGGITEALNLLFGKFP